MEGGEVCLQVEESAEEVRCLGCLDPRGAVPGSELGARGPVADILRLFPGVWSMLVCFMAILGVSEAASRINIAMDSFLFSRIDLRAATNVNEEYSSEI